MPTTIFATRRPSSPGRGRCFLGNAATTPIVTPTAALSYSTVLSQDVRTNGMLKVGYDVTDRLKLTADVNISIVFQEPAARGHQWRNAYMAGSRE